MRGRICWSDPKRGDSGPSSEDALDSDSGTDVVADGITTDEEDAVGSIEEDPTAEDEEVAPADAGSLDDAVNAAAGTSAEVEGTTGAGKGWDAPSLVGAARRDLRRRRILSDLIALDGILRALRPDNPLR